MGRDRKRVAMQQWPHSVVRHGPSLSGKGEWSGLAPLLHFGDEEGQVG